MSKFSDHLKTIYRKEMFQPSCYLGIWINPYFIIRRGLFRGIRRIADEFVGEKLLDVGCGSKPYEKLFNVTEYIGIDVEVSGHDHSTSRIDHYYDGQHVPFGDQEFDFVFSSEVIEHVFHIDALLAEINRVLKKNGRLALTCPFVWNEHEIPYDFARYTSFGITRLLERHGFAVTYLAKSTHYFPTIMQMLSAYVYQHLLPQKRILRIVLAPILVSPLNIFGELLGKILPKRDSFYHNNVVIATKR